MTQTPRFSEKPDPTDVLTVAGDMAMEAIRVKLGLAGIGTDDYTVTVCIEHGKGVATCVHVPGTLADDEVNRRALEVQLSHAQITAKAMGLHLTYRALRVRHG